jgi:hypothetical protein
VASIPKLKGFVLEDFKEAPGWFSKLLTPLNEYLTTVTNALSGKLTRKDNLLSYVEPFDFTTAATAANTFPLRFKNKLPGNIRPGVVFMGRFARENNASLTGAYSMTWTLNSIGEIEITCQGLENSTRYVGNLVVEG